MDVIATDSGYDPIALGAPPKGGRRANRRKYVKAWANP